MQGGRVPREMRIYGPSAVGVEVADQGPCCPRAWIVGDDEMGRPAWFRRELAGRGEQHPAARRAERATSAIWKPTRPCAVNPANRRSGLSSRFAEVVMNRCGRQRLDGSTSS